MRILYDIGANRGLYTDVHIHNYDKCVLVDPNPELCNFLRNKYAGNQKIIVVNKIVSKDKDVPFYMCDKADTISTADIEWVKNSRFTKDYTWYPVNGIETVSIDTLILENGAPTFIKIDVEGYEYNVILSMTSNQGPLSFEWSEEKQDEMIRTVEYLSFLGYSKFALQQKDEYAYEVRDEEWVSNDAIVALFRSSLLPSRREFWGMIWAT